MKITAIKVHGQMYENEDVVPTEEELNYIHLLNVQGEGDNILCSGLVLEEITYTEYKVKKGTINCPECIDILKLYKSVPL